MATIIDKIITAIENKEWDQISESDWIQTLNALIRFGVEDWRALKAILKSHLLPFLEQIVFTAPEALWKQMQKDLANALSTEQGAHHRTAPDRIIVYNESQILNLFISSEQQKDYENLARELLTASLDLLLAVVNEDLCSQVSTLLFNEGLENAEIIRRLLLILNEHLNKLIIRLPHSTLSNRDQVRTSVAIKTGKLFDLLAIGDEDGGGEETWQAFIQVLKSINPQEIQVAKELLVEWVSTEINTEHLRAYNSEINEILKNTVKFLDLLLDEKLFTDILAIINKIVFVSERRGWEKPENFTLNEWKEIAADKILNLGNNIVAKFRCLAQPERALPRVTEEEKNRVLSKLSLGVTPYGIMNLTAFPRLLDSFQRIISGSLPEGIPSQNELAYCFFSALSWDKVEKVLAPAELREEKVWTTEKVALAGLVLFVLLAVGALLWNYFAKKKKKQCGKGGIVSG